MTSNAIRHDVLKHPSLRSPEGIHHLGLRWDRFCRVHGDDDAVRDDRQAFFRSFQTFPPEVMATYTALAAARERMLDQRHARTKRWRVSNRLCFGSGDRGVLEVGIRFHWTYGVPVIAGSALKGVARAMGEKARVDVRSLLGGGDEGEDAPGLASAVTFHDAIWIPAPQDASPFSVDTITVHHPEYYRSNSLPEDSDSPTPIGLLSAQGTFLFAVEGDEATAEQALRLLGTALRDCGVGARTAKGYGRFDVPDQDTLWPRSLAMPLFDTGAAPAPRAVTPPAVVVPPPVHSVDNVRLSFQPNTGRFQMVLVLGGRSVRVETPPSPVALLPGDDDAARLAAFERLKATCRRKDFASAKVTYEVRGPQHFEVIRIEPNA